MRVQAAIFTIVTALCAACAPTINPAVKASIDRRAAALHTSAATFPSTAVNEPLPLAVGQWVQHLFTDERGQRSFLTYKVVGSEGDAFWIECVTENYAGKTVTGMLLHLGDRTNLENIEVRALKVRQDAGEVETYPSNLLPLLKPIWKPLVEALAVRFDGLSREDVSVPAGHFEQAAKYREQGGAGALQHTSDVWFHAAVPVNAVVRSAGVDRPGGSELVAFGLDGAQSEL